MSERRATLVRLCASHGIATHYHDIWGTRHEVPETGLHALLSLFGVDATTPESAARAEQAVRTAQWEQCVAPAIAIGESTSPWRASLRLPAALASLRWRIEEESGRIHEGGCEAAALGETGFERIGGRDFAQRELDLAVALPAGYHRLRLLDGERVLGESLVIAAPPRCYWPEALAGGARVWGPSVQLYALRSERNWGIGDFGDLGRLVEDWAALGAGIVGLNPLHALFPPVPGHASPYSPSSRERLNVLYLDVEAIEDSRECEAAQRLVRSAPFQARLAALRESPLVDYEAVAAAKYEVLAHLHAAFRENHLGRDTARAREFRDYQAKGGLALRRHALFEALHAEFHAADPVSWGWRHWPGDCRDPDPENVARLASARLERVEYQEYLQWQAERQLARVAARCGELGLVPGLYLDLAVSVDGAGSDTWSDPGVYALEASVGAPPDEFNPKGQDWGLPPLRPDRLRAEGYASLRRALAANMREAGALRIDHVMGLMRLFWNPRGAGAGEGGYVHYAFDELLAIVALESHRNRCLVIGEDLGTVPDEVRAGLARIGVLSYRLLYFERANDGAFRPAADYPAEALVAVSTHDLATLAGWWEGRDLAVRRELGLFPANSTYEKQLVDRAQERVRLMLALEHAGLLPEGTVVDPAGSQALTEALGEAVHAFVASTPSRVMMVQLEDALGATAQANLPGTTSEHPNWRRKLPRTLEAMRGLPRVASLARRMSAARPRPARPASAAAPELRIPRATYRLQMHAGFGFDEAIAILPYLARLGVSHVYCSPLLRARSDSMHGYDITNHGEIAPALGGAAGFARFQAALRAHGLGLLFDMVPNHMAVLGADNAWWMDVLECGPASLHARYFDIDWLPANPELAGKVLIPVLGEHYGVVLAGGELQLRFEPATGEFAVGYHEHRFPVDPRGYAGLLRRGGDFLPADAPGEARGELASLASAFGHLPSRESTGAAEIAERSRDKAAHKRRLAALAGAHPAIERALSAAVAETNAVSAGGEREALHALLEAQAWRLAYWRVASDEINYRRFFDINALAALRMEDEQVFEATHGFTLELAASGGVDGLRIDHPDGLYDPAQYFRRLQEGYARRAGIALGQEEEGGRPARPLYVLAEKITAPHEHLPEGWSLHGTTGYRFAAVANALFVDAGAAQRIERTWRSFTGEALAFAEIAYRSKREILRNALASELTTLATEIHRIARADLRTRDYTFNTLREALAEVAACMPVYRTYIAGPPSAQDRRFIDWAVAHAARRSRAADPSILGFVRQLLLGAAPEGAPPGTRERALRFAMRFQQLTSPLAAKGVEDTALYVFNRLVSLNEVGSDPETFGMSVRAFHGASADRAARWPHTMLATSTHDNKRSEDVRQRIDVISEMPAAWRLLLRRWSTLNRSARSSSDDEPVPSRNDEYLLYQTLVGTYPAQGLEGPALDDYRARIEAYMLKAAREAKRRTSWISQDEAYERGLGRFVASLLSRERANPFLDDLQAQAARFAAFGALGSVSLVLLKLSCPGVPDLYQGNELVDLSLVDPDNRRPVDFALRARLLEEVLPADAARAREIARTPHDGRAKLLVTARLLGLRREDPELFRRGSYVAHEARGEKAAHVVAFSRRHEARSLTVIAARFFAKLAGETGDFVPGPGSWTGTEIPADGLAEGTRLVNVITGEPVTVRGGAIAMAEAFADFPAAALVPEDASRK
ncbi:MAG: malto-oligosyltrehalose synthase [Burkholderiales bacterium]